MKRILPILLVLLLLSSLLAGCVKKSSAAGTYTIKTMNGETMEEQLKPMLDEGMSMEDILSLFSIASLDEYFVLELKADGSMISRVAGEDSVSGTWKQEGDKVTAVIDGETLEMTLKGNELSFSTDDQSFVFVKK
ncbi:MAG: hypothetical protein IKX19_10570 [Clostridia bacterium]|nr:hypothetical protein [Clostridia bacterium]